MAMILDVKKFGCFPSKMFICQKIKTTAKKKKNHDYCFFLFYVLGETYDRLLILYE